MSVVTPAHSHELGQRIIHLGRRLGSLHYELVHSAAAFDHTGTWATDGCTTCASWIADALAVSLGTAREWLRVGHALGRLPAIDASFEAGRLSFAQVRTLTRIAVDHPERDAELVDLAESTPARELGVALAGWTTANEEPEELDRRQRAHRGLAARIEPDGMGVIVLRLPPLEHGTIMATVDSVLMTTKRAEIATTDATMPPSVAEFPSVPQQRADALVGLVTSGGTKVATEVIVHLRADGASLDDGTPITDSLAERLVPRSTIRAMIHDAESHPINVSGKHRYPTDRQRLVVKERDRTCSCGAIVLLDCHHEPPFAVTKRTLVDELKLKCKTCHRRRHRTGSA